MEFQSSHPLENITRKNPYSILEALIPFVDYPMKLPLALLVKYQEVRLILNAFQSADTISQYGLHNSSAGPMDMIANIMGVSPEMLKTILSIIENQHSNNIAGNNDNYFNFNNTGCNDNLKDFDNTGYNDNLKDFDNNTDSNDHNSNQEKNINSYTNAYFHDSLDENIKNIFAEYDLLRAAEYNEENNELQTNTPDKDTEYRYISDTGSHQSCNHDNTEPEYYI